MIDLDNAREVIERQKCRENRPGDAWCETHDDFWPRSSASSESSCPMRPEVTDVAAELLAEVERLDGVSIGLLQVTLADLRAELNAALAIIDRVRALTERFAATETGQRDWWDHGDAWHAAAEIQKALEGIDNA